MIETLKLLASIEYDLKNLEIIIVEGFNDSVSESVIKGFLERNPSFLGNNRTVDVEENVATKA